MSKGNTFENDLLALIFNATPIANLADDAGTSPLTDLYVSLHTADPTESGDQTSNECAYTGYARVAVARTSGGWTVSGNTVNPVSNIVFGDPTSGPETATHVGIGTDASGTGKLLYYGALSASISITNGGAAPEVSSSSTITED